MHVKSQWWGRAALVATMFAGVLAAQGAEEAKGGAPDVGAAVAKVRIFAGLTEAERTALLPAVTLSRGKAGDRVIEQGKQMKRMLVIMEGKADVQVGGKAVATLADQPLVGEIEFLEGVPASADVILQGDSVLLEIDNAKLNAVFEVQPRIGYVVMRAIATLESGRLRQMNPK